MNLERLNTRWTWSSVNEQLVFCIDPYYPSDVSMRGDINVATSPQWWTDRLYNKLYYFTIEPDILLNFFTITIEVFLPLLKRRVLISGRFVVPCIAGTWRCYFAGTWWYYFVYLLLYTIVYIYLIVYYFFCISLHHWTISNKRSLITKSSDVQCLEAYREPPAHVGPTCASTMHWKSITNCIQCTSKNLPHFSW